MSTLFDGGTIRFLWNPSWIGKQLLAGGKGGETPVQLDMCLSILLIQNCLWGCRSRTTDFEDLVISFQTEMSDRGDVLRPYGALGTSGCVPRTAPRWELQDRSSRRCGPWEGCAGRGCGTVTAAILLAAFLVALFAYAGVGVDPIRLPGLAAVCGEGLLGAHLVRRDRPDGKAD